MTTRYACHTYHNINYTRYDIIHLVASMYQAEKKKMEGDFDTRMENFKQSILTAHALDIAKLQDSTLAEMKRIKVCI